MQQTAGDLGFRRLAPAKDLSQADELVQSLSEALAAEGLANYFTRRSPEAAQRLWAELLRLLLSAAGPTAEAPQLYFLSDATTVAVMQRWPEDRAGWHPYSALLRMGKIVPWGKWRALREALLALDKQKAAFAQSHGPFLHLAAVGTARDFRGAGLGSMLLDHLCRVADAQGRYLYTEATSDAARAWLRRAGFFELLRHVVRPHAPVIHVLVRKPRQAAAEQQTAQAQAGQPGRQHSSSGGGGRGQGAGAAAAAGPVGAAPEARLRPSGSVRTR